MRDVSGDCGLWWLGKCPKVPPAAKAGAVQAGSCACDAGSSGTNGGTVLAVGVGSAGTPWACGVLEEGCDEGGAGCASCRAARAVLRKKL